MANKPVHLDVNSVREGVKQDVHVRTGCEFPWSPLGRRSPPSLGLPVTLI